VRQHLLKPACPIHLQGLSPNEGYEVIKRPEAPAVTNCQGAEKAADLRHRPPPKKGPPKSSILPLILKKSSRKLAKILIT
jgi:hypothetical protein